MDRTVAPPVLSTPAEHILEDHPPTFVPTSETRLSEEELYLQYEIPRTIREIREGRWKSIALQFPDAMLVDAPRVFERLRDGLRKDRRERAIQKKQRLAKDDEADQAAANLAHAKLEDGEDVDPKAKQNEEDDNDDVEERLCILADTSYGACCVDEVAAEHVDADVVVHYGRTCLSPTARLPTIYVFTFKPLDLAAVHSSFTALYKDKDQAICLMADVPYHHHLPAIHDVLEHDGFTNLFVPDIIHDPSSLLPNRTVPPEVKEDPSKLKDYSVFHISNPPTPLILILASRVKNLHIYPTATSAPPATYTTPAAPVLRRRYALLAHLPAAPIIGILINTLSVSNYMAALSHCQALIAAAGKKSYTFVVGKVNVAKLANFSEVAAWVVISCWESSLLEGLGRDFMAPVVTPFELVVALSGLGGWVFGGVWVGDFAGLIGDGAQEDADTGNTTDKDGENKDVIAPISPTAPEGEAWDDQPSDTEEPDFDLRTGKYISRTRPMGRPTTNPTNNDDNLSSSNTHTSPAPPAPPSSALVQRAKTDMVAINGTHSPGAEYLRSKRTWHGLGSDYEIAYERDEEGKIRGAAMEEGRSGVAQGYSVGEDNGGVKS